MTTDLEITHDLHVLCSQIGERLAGSSAEKKAARHVTGRLEAMGLIATTQNFPCMSVVESVSEVQEPGRNGSWAPVDSIAIVGASSTPGGRMVESPLLWLDMPEAQHRLQGVSLKGSILAIFGPMPTSEKVHRDLVAAAPDAVIHVDERFPFEWAKADGTYPYWRGRYGMPPTVSIPYMAAWRWRRDGVNRLRVRVLARQKKAFSSNVIAEWPGTDRTLPAIAFTSHLDTQPGNEGADDNAAGVALMLALARRLCGRTHRRTLRFIAFGTEEQLSVGATDYVRSNRVSPSHTGLVLNFDSVASPLGHYVLWTAGDQKLARFAVKSLARRDVDAAVVHDITAFVDCFAFNRVGIPSLWFRRMNFPGGRWQHHSHHDTLENVSQPQLKKFLDAIAPIGEDLANRPAWPFAATLSAPQRAAARRISRTLLGW